MNAGDSAIFVCLQMIKHMWICMDLWMLAYDFLYLYIYTHYVYIMCVYIMYILCVYIYTHMYDT